MSRLTRFGLTLVIIGSVSVAAAAVMAAERDSAPGERTMPDSCADMMNQAGVTDDGRKAMQGFMSSEHGAQAMTNMMAMARRMGNGDPMLGMTRMMEMMGDSGHGMGGMMGGSGGGMDHSSGGMDHMMGSSGPSHSPQAPTK